VRAADLIGQLADAPYLRRINALYYEFVETGVVFTIEHERRQLGPHLAAREAKGL
jgi:hypothetical protein